LTNSKASPNWFHPPTGTPCRSPDLMFSFCEMTLRSVEALFAPLAPIVGSAEVQLRGEWSTSNRRIYARREQLGSGEGPYREAVDARWRGTIEGSEPLAGILLFRRPAGTKWVKSRPAALKPRVAISLMALSGERDRVSFAAGFHGAYLPSFPVAAREPLVSSCARGPETISIGVPTLLAQAQDVATLLVLLPSRLLKTRRARLWRLREDMALHLPTDLREILTRGRTGSIGEA
jgi:hypothetical protein